MRLGLLMFTTLLVGCAAPSHFAHRSPLVEVPAEPLAPEARPASVPPVPPATEETKIVAAQASLADETAPTPTTAKGEALAATARELLGRRTLVIDGRRFPNDCTGLVRAVYSRNGLELSGDSATLYQYALRHGTVRRDQPRVGDIVFFKETYDRNHDGRVNDGLTHVGIVESIDNEETVSIIHRVPRGVVRYHMNVSHPRERCDANGHVLNDWLRPGKRPRLTGELFVGYGTLFDSPAELPR